VKVNDRKQHKELMTKKDKERVRLGVVGVGSLGNFETLVPSVFVLGMPQALLRPSLLLTISRCTFVGGALLYGRPLFVLLIAFLVGLEV
jgi:hypothetical protein